MIFTDVIIQGVNVAMPRKKTTKSNEEKNMVQKKEVTDSFNQVKLLLSDRIATTIAELVNENALEREHAKRITSVLTTVATGCVDTIRANRGM